MMTMYDFTSVFVFPFTDLEHVCCSFPLSGFYRHFRRLYLYTTIFPARLTVRKEDASCLRSALIDLSVLESVPLLPHYYHDGVVVIKAQKHSLSSHAKSAHVLQRIIASEAGETVRRRGRSVLANNAQVWTRASCDSQTNADTDSPI
jgi:hypothetical protein